MLSLFKHKGLPAEETTTLAQITHLTSKPACSFSHCNPCFLLIVTKLAITGLAILAIVLSLLHQ